MRRVVRSAGFLLMSHGVSLASALVVLALSARYLGPARFGEQAVFRSIAHIALPLLTGGLRVNVAKEIGRNPEGAASYVGSVLTLRWAIAVVVTATALLIVYALPLTPERELAGIATILLLLSGMWQMVAGAIFVAYERSEYVLAMSLTSALLTIPLTALVIRLDAGIPGILAAAAVAPLITAQVGFTLASRRLVRPKLIVDLGRWRKIVRDSLPVGIGAMLRRSYARVDVLLLAALRSAEAAGVFSVAYRAAIEVTAMSVTVGTAILPRLSRLAERSRDRLRTTFEYLLLILLSLSIPSAGMVAAFAGPVVALLVGPQFLSSVGALRLISIAIVTAIPGALLFFCLVALGKERLAVRYLAISVAANVVFDILLIPWLGVSGACLGTIGAEWLYFALSLGEIHRSLKLTMVWRPLAKLAGAAILMALAIHIIGAEQAAAAAPVGLATFIAACALSKALPAGTRGALRAALARPRADATESTPADPDFPE